MIHPMPSYLRNLVTEVNEEILSRIQGEYGHYTTAFIFNTAFKRLIRTWIPDYNTFGSTLRGINSNDEKISLFNPSENGYNGLFDIDDEENLSLTQQTEFGGEYELIIAFQYSGEEAEYALEGKSPFEEDYFDWLVVYTLFENILDKIIDIECA